MTNDNKTQQISVSVLKNSPKTKYPQLTLFQQREDQERLCPKQQPYETKRRSTFHYRMTFFSFGLLFSWLAYFVIGSKMSWALGVFFGVLTMAKPVLAGFAMTLALLAFGYAFIIKPEKEALVHLTAKAKRRLQLIYQKGSGAGDSSLFSIFSGWSWTDFCFSS